MFWFWLLIVLLIVWIATLPSWPYGRRYDWGYYPFGTLSAILLIFLLLWLFGVFAVTY
jgi:hypothetical protein